MDKFFEQLANINAIINDFVWVKIGLILLIGAGILMTVCTRFFQVSHLKHWWVETIGSVFKRNSDSTKKTDKASITQFQALCTALAATIGTGNIAGVAAAIVIGGPGAVFWMWLAAFFGMMTNYSENVLGIFYRRKNAAGEWCGGAMYYLRDGLGSKRGMKQVGKILAVFFSIFTLFASFGIGNMGQVVSISESVTSVFSFTGGNIKADALIIGIIIMLVAFLVIVGGIKRIASANEKLVPFMALFYITGALVIVVMNYEMIIPAFASIFKNAFSTKAAAGGIGGAVIMQAVTWGFKRGVFSNEAGLGSSVMVHSASNVKEPVVQGLWGIFEVFLDTIVVCTLTALVVLTSGVVDLETGASVSGATKLGLATEAFTNSFGTFGGIFIAIAITLFAFSTVLGWSYYGTKAWEFLFGTKSTIIYKIVFVVMIVVCSTLDATVAIDLSDTFNGLMAIPNLIGVLTLSPLVVKLTKNYVNRRMKNIDEKPLLSAFPDIQKEHEENLD